MQHKISIIRRRAIVLVLLAGGFVLLGLGYAWLVRTGHGIPCPFNRITGFRCPGCGISRALVALLQGQFSAFIQYNTLAPLIVPYLIWLGFFTAKEYIRHGRFSYSPPCRWVDILMLVAVLLWWPLRNILGI